jgi:phosphatidylglycerol---prolipoprotein diacylglyceryl transferase
MLYTHNINPIALDFGFFQIRWYGLAYAISFLFGFLWLHLLAKNKHISLNAVEVENFLFATIVGVLLGGRLGYFLFYNFSQIFSLEIFKIWNGGMSFHGGFLGALIGIFYFARKNQKSFFELTDLIAIPIAIGLMLGRIANFINGNLFGRPTNTDFGVIFAIDKIPRYPSQLYEAAKNFLIAGILFFTFAKKPPRGLISFLFATFYGAGRIIVELFWREPLNGFILGLPRGAFFSVPILLVGMIGVVKSLKAKK